MDNRPEIKWIRSVKLYLVNLYTSKKQNVIRCICFLSAVLIVLIPSLTMNLWLQQVNSSSSHIGILHVVINSGVSFSMLSNTPEWLVYFLQSIMSLAILVTIAFANKWYYTFLLSLSFMGGLFNIIDRATPCSFMFDIGAYPAHTLIYHVVIDYFTFGGSTAVFNFPDIFILTGIIGAAMIYFGLAFWQYFKQSKIDRHE